MKEREKLRILLPHWIEHNGEHAEEFRHWAAGSGTVEDLILAAADLVEKANERLEEALKELGGPVEQDHPYGHSHD